MVSIFQFSDYRGFLKKRFDEMPKKGYGQASKLATAIGVHTTLISQVLSGIKTFTLEQASLVAEFFGLNDLETEYFLLLVQLDRAGNESLKKNLKKQIDNLKARSSELVNRMRSDKKLSEEERAVFYSDWIYSAVRQLTAIKEFHNLDAIAAYLNLSTKRTKEIIDFLLATGLCQQEKNRLVVGPSHTHLESSSPWVRTHHMNWRQRALQELNREEKAKIHYTGPMTLSKEDALVVREMIAKFLEEIKKVVDPSPSEELRCLNIDWFKI